MGNHTLHINARVAQLVEHDLAKVGAAGSSPVSRSWESKVFGSFFIVKSGLVCKMNKEGRKCQGVNAFMFSSFFVTMWKGIKNKKFYLKFSSSDKIIF